MGRAIMVGTNEVSTGDYGMCVGRLGDCTHPAGVAPGPSHCFLRGLTSKASGPRRPAHSALCQTRHHLTSPLIPLTTGVSVTLRAPCCMMHLPALAGPAGDKQAEEQ